MCFIQPTQVYMPNSKSILSAIFAQITAESPHTLNRRLNLSKLPFPMGESGPHVTWFLQHIETHNVKGISINLAVFWTDNCWVTEYAYILQCDVPFPLKIATPNVRIWTPSNTCFLGPTQVLNPNGISITSVGFAQLTAETPYIPQNWPIPWRNLDPHLTRFLWPIWAHNLNGISIDSAISTDNHIVTDCAYTLQMDTPFILKIVPSN